MSKLVNWGQWMVAAVFAGHGCRYLVNGFLRVPELIRATHVGTFPYYQAAKSLLWLPFLVCAWGVLKWRWWGHIIALALAGILALASFLELITLTLSAGNIYPSQFYISLFVLVTLPFACILTWLLLPKVRTLFWHGDLPA